MEALKDFDWDSLEHVEFRREQCLENMIAQLNVQDSAKLTKSQFNSNKAKKEELAFWLEDAVQMLEIQSELLSRFKETVELMKLDMVVDKSRLISTQEKLLESQSDQLVKLKTAVESTVQNTVQKEIKSYSEAVGNQSKQMGASEVQESVKKAVKSAIQEDDRSKNLIIFGLAESEKEQIDTKVADLFAELGESTKISASRIGAKPSGTVSRCRPVKCTLASSNVVHQMLLKARQLKLVEGYKSVFICPDRSPEERAARRALVLELKTATVKHPDYKYFIKNGKVHREKR